MPAIHIRYMRPDGSPVVYELGERPITLGRSPDADIIVLDEKASRIHCGIRLWDGAYFIKDLKSKNGTFVNDHPVESAKLHNGDVIRIGESMLFVEMEQEIGTMTAIREIGGQMEQGKGYSTILRQIVREVPGSNAPPSVPPSEPSASQAEAPAEPAPSAPAEEAPKPSPTGRKPVRITIRRAPDKS